MQILVVRTFLQQSIHAASGMTSIISLIKPYRAWQVRGQHNEGSFNKKSLLLK